MDMILKFIIETIKESWVNIAWIIVLFLFGKAMLRILVKRLSAMVDDGDDAVKSQEEKRAETLGHIILATGNIIIYTIILIMILSLFGIDIRPILASAGVIGLAVGFGAQSLVKDFVSGLFILLENQYGVGDKVKIGSFTGNVEKITMRSTVLVDDDGNKYYISNGSISNVVNMSHMK